ncbi:MAG: xanthine dehydrogenase family protein molybdopterin-binding subunit [Elusimicrobia bacterium]|nr:xanthine dehydrogenase family protein molybdopterin-binding subunit [Elusimicrobiota bacterium]
MNVIGVSVARNDAQEKVAGTAKYIDDYAFGNMLYGATVRSSVACGKILSIDTATALKISGVAGVFTYRDVPGKNSVPLVFGDYPFLAENNVLFYGQPVALLVADSEETARHAARQVRVEYEKAPAVFDVLEALKKDSPKIYGDNNVFKKYDIIKGDIAKGFKDADVRVEDVFTTNYQVHCYMEPQGMVADPQPDGGMAVYGTMQCPFYVHDAVAAILGVSQNRVKIVQTTTGGAFGGKEDVPSVVAGHSALLAHLTKRPVKIIYTREEDFHSMSKRHPSRVEIKYGAKKNGKITACSVRYILDAGAFSTLSPIVLWRGAVHSAGPYDIPNVKIEALAVATNKVPCGAFRGFGQPQATFANESLIDKLAEKLSISPLKLRRLNMLGIGSETATGQKIEKSCGFKKVIDTVVEKAKWDKIYLPPEKRSGRVKTGIGVAAAFYGVGLGAGGRHLDRAGSYVQIQKDGAVLVAIGNTEMGQGLLTVVSQIAAEALGAPYDFIKVMLPDTTRVPDSGPTVASRSTLMSGNAVKNACEIIRRNIDRTVLGMAGVRKGASYKGEVCSDGKNYFIKGAPKKKINYFELVKKCYAARVNLSSNGWYTGEEVDFSDVTGQGKAYYVYTYSATVAIVSVNTETGEVDVKKIVSGHDIGRAINPQQCEGQIEGGVMQAAGYALTENLVLKDGIIQNPNFAGYLIPTPDDVPEIVPVIVEEAYSDGPYGAKGLGESPMITPAAAIANAIYNATGWRVYSLPATPEVLTALRANFNHGRRHKICTERKKG